MDKAIPIFLQNGAMGVLALAFIVLLILLWRSDKRAQKYAQHLGEVTFDRRELIGVIVGNTKASLALAEDLKQVARSQDKACTVLDRLDRRLESEDRRCAADRKTA